MRKVLFTLLALLIVVAGMTVMSCGGEGNGTSTATNTQNQQGQDNDNDDDVVILGDDSWEFSDIPEYPGAGDTYKMRGEEPGDPPIIVETLICGTDDSVEKVSDFYRAAMANEGWTEAYWGAFTGGFMGSFTKPGDVAAAIGIARTDEGTTMITLDKRYPKS